jgi:hypothetical protein
MTADIENLVREHLCVMRTDAAANLADQGSPNRHTKALRNKVA